MYNFTAELDLLTSAVWQYYIPVPQSISKELIQQDCTRLICAINDTIKFHCALMPKGEGRYFINLNKERRKILMASQFTELKVSIAPDKSEYGLPMPTEFKELLHQDPEGDHVFHNLTPGKQRTLLHLVGKYKNTETRINKSIVIVEYLKRVNGKLDFKELNIAFKNQNR